MDKAELNTIRLKKMMVKDIIKTDDLGIKFVDNDIVKFLKTNGFCITSDEYIQNLLNESLELAKAKVALREATKRLEEINAAMEAANNDYSN